MLVCTPNTDSREADAMRKLTFAMNLSLDGYIAAPGDDLGWSVPSDELFQWWSDRVDATGLALYGRKLWETLSSHWSTGDQLPGGCAACARAGAGRECGKLTAAPRPPPTPPPDATGQEGRAPRRWQEMPK